MSPSKRPYIAVNIPRKWGRYLDEALKKLEVSKQVEIAGCSKTRSGLGKWIIREFLINNTDFRFRYLNTYDDHATIMDIITRQVADIYPEKEGVLRCKQCDSVECEHVNFALTVPEIMEPLKKKGWEHKGSLP